MAATEAVQEHVVKIYDIIDNFSEVNIRFMFSLFYCTQLLRQLEIYFHHLELIK